MSFEFTQRRRIAHQVREIAGEQISKAIEESGAGADAFDDVVHRVRRRCKKLRGLVRLVEPHFDGFAEENKAFREAANGLSSTRDAAVMEETWLALVTFDIKHSGPDAMPSELTNKVGAAFDAREKESAQTASPEKLLGDFRQIFEEAGERASHWHLTGSRFERIGDGLEKTYRGMRKAMHSAEHTQAPEQMHDWRKVVKYHWHHVGLFLPAAPAMLAARKDALGKLGDKLGDHHNLAVLEDTLGKMDILGAGERDVVRKAIAGQQAKLSEGAFVLGRQLAAERPSALRARFEKYWALLPGEA